MTIARCLDLTIWDIVWQVAKNINFSASILLILPYASRRQVNYVDVKNRLAPLVHLKAKMLFHLFHHRLQKTE